MTTEKNKATDEDDIRRQIDGFVKAFCTRDVNLMMSLYAPGIVSFDIVPPLQDVGKNAYRKVWGKTFKSFRDPIDIRIRDLNIIASDDAAFSYKLLQLRATGTAGQKIDHWERLTFCFRKIEGKWLIAHEHVSVPVDLGSGRAALNLQP